MKKLAILFCVLVVVGFCGAMQLRFEQQKRMDEMTKYNQVVGIAEKEADALVAQADAIREQAHAIAVQADSNAKAVDQVVELSDKMVTQSEIQAKSAAALAGMLCLIMLVLFIVLRKRPA